MDLDVFLDRMAKGMKSCIYTGRGPSGNIHIGHMISYTFFKNLSKSLNIPALFQISDDEKYLHDKLGYDDMDTIQNNIRVIKNLGIPNLDLIWNTKDIDRLYPLALKAAKYINLNIVKSVFGFTGSSNLGQNFFPCLEIAPFFLKQFEEKEEYQTLVIMGEDQIPFYYLARDVAKKYKFPIPAAIVVENMMSLSGPEFKMSSSKNDGIFLGDSPEVVSTKIQRAVTAGGETLELHKLHGGKPEKCPIFHIFSDLVEKSDGDLKIRKEACRKGNLSCKDCKKQCTEQVVLFLNEHNPENS